MSLDSLKKLRSETGASFADCKSALSEANDSYSEALQLVLKLQAERVQDEQKQELEQEEQQRALRAAHEATKLLSATVEITAGVVFDEWSDNADPGPWDAFFSSAMGIFESPEVELRVSLAREGVDFGPLSESAWKGVSTQAPTSLVAELLTRVESDGHSLWEIEMEVQARFNDERFAGSPEHPWDAESTFMSIKDALGRLAVAPDYMNVCFQPADSGTLTDAFTWGGYCGSAMLEEGPLSAINGPIGEEVPSDKLPFVRPIGPTV